MDTKKYIINVKSHLAKSHFLQDILKVITSNTLILILSFVSGIITARYLGVEGKGLLTILLVYPGLMISISHMGIRQAVVYEIGRKKYSFEKVVGNIISLFLFTSTIGTLLCFLILSNSPLQNYRNIWILLAVLTIPISLIGSYTGGIFIGKGKIGLSTIVAWVPKFLGLIALIILLIILKTGITGALIATIIAGIPVAAYAIIQVSHEVSLRPSINSAILKNMLGLGSVYALATFLNSLNYRIDIIMLERLSSAREVGLYSTGVNFAEIVLQVPAAVGIVLFSRSSNAENPKEFSNITIKLFKYGMLISVFAAIVISLIAPFIIPFLYKEDFRDSVPMLQLLMPGIIALVGYKILGFDMAGKGKPWASVFASFPGLITNVILNFLLIPKYGGNGASIASSVSYTIMVIIHWIIFKRILNNYKPILKN